MSNIQSLPQSYQPQTPQGFTPPQTGGYDASTLGGPQGIPPQTMPPPSPTPQAGMPNDPTGGGIPTQQSSLLQHLNPRNGGPPPVSSYLEQLGITNPLQPSQGNQETQQRQVIDQQVQEMGEKVNQDKESIGGMLGVLKEAASGAKQMREGIKQ